MSTYPVAIVGAGPAGLALGLALAKFKIRSIILEKDLDVTDDPRGVILPMDSIRIFWDLGVKEELWTIMGHVIPHINFHRCSLQNTPFFTDSINEDALNQGVPDGVLMIQPKLERRLRDLAIESQYCELYCGQEVTAIKESTDSMTLEYKQSNSEKIQQLECRFLIGADGKRGFVRKGYLEPVAGVKQETGLLLYEATWVAANLHITPPTPETHPEFPLWRLGYRPDEVYDLFWPKGWHFCSPPGKPTACGRFGPHSDHLWRHEFAESEWQDSMDPVQNLWEMLTPMLTRSKDAGLTFPQPVIFPKDCIEIMRCAPYHFAQKVVNKWFYNRTILIGDAAHVFPPFGGQGIASGIRDAHGLAWRLALLLQQPLVDETRKKNLLTSWSQERRQGVDDASRFTLRNGTLTNTGETWDFALNKYIMAAASRIPFLPKRPNDLTTQEERGYKATEDGFFLARHGGGGKLAQIHVISDSGSHVLSDELLKLGQSALSLVITDDDTNMMAQYSEVNRLLQTVDLHPSILSKDSLVLVSNSKFQKNVLQQQSQRYFRPASRQELENVFLGSKYDEKSYFKRFGPHTRFAIVRSDFIIFALAKDLSELKICLELLKERLTGQLELR